ncbi:ankyrin repeat domain-containing protein 40-like isoform X2 [Coturnix japonica]|uniref:ankyrin repeat domain-containing protein 40-like isoform X2 n=1 Tax=Coturnix japonica TaxID=93934 RepID=UPI000777DF0C|nr:ankyrin repeat domain-containing protein 40-like isoform X2 [Coturnix japonica]
MSGGTSELQELQELQERLREAAALGDEEEVRRLLEAGADVNSRNEIDGWTCLHWACKRSHAPVVALLLDAGADRSIRTGAGQLAEQLTGRENIRRILAVTEEEDCQAVSDVTPPAAASSVSAPPSPHSCTDGSPAHSSAESLDESAPISPASHGEISPRSPAAHVEAVCTPTPCCTEDGLPAPDAAAQLPITSAAPSASERSELGVQSSSWQPPAHSPALCVSAPPSQAMPLSSCPAPGAAPAFQPFFLTGPFPYHMQELVLKVRVQNLRDDDFIEIELDRQELTYQDLLRVSCCELGVNPQHVERIRKLPNTVLRKDKDVARLRDFQELELVLVKSDSSPFRNAASALTDRPCYNSRASKLTY